MSAKITLNEDQEATFDALQKFISHPGGDTFVLKGYAGTGKTFLMQYFAKWLKQAEHEFALLASTGRAAAVLRGKTGFDARTVHGEVYQFSRVEGDEADIPDDAPIDRFGQMTLQFLRREPDVAKKIYIVDESSMLSSEYSENEAQLAFGSGFLMDDFFEAVGNNKIIFVGDPGQLPPVGQVFSPALDMKWLAKSGRTAITATLEKMERHDADNDILLLASMIRTLADMEFVPRFPKLPARQINHCLLYQSQKDLLQQYIEKYKELGAGGTLAIARSNRMVNAINQAVRQELYGDASLPLQSGEVMMVVQNNYAVPLANGDFVQVTELGETRVQGSLQFQRVKVKALAADVEYEMLLSLDVLNSQRNDFTIDQTRELRVDFSRRMRKKGITVNSPAYKAAMMTDKYLNCLRAKYGYAVTCHKAQGGEWDDVFLFLDKSMYGMPGAELFRWWYTAVTRARKWLHLEKGWWIG